MIVGVLVLYTGYIICLGFFTVSLAAGLYYLAEIIEEYASTTKRVIGYTIYGVIGLHILIILFEDLSTINLLFGIFAHIIYSTMLKDFPYIQLTDPKFVVSIVVALIHHILWFLYFTENYMEFEEIAAFFIVCVWLVPFAFFISLSGNDSTLPYGILSASGELNRGDSRDRGNFETYPLGGGSQKKRKNFILSNLDKARRFIGEFLPSSSGRNREQKNY